MKRRRFLAGVAAASLAPAAFAATYLTVAEAQRVLFADADSFVPASLARGVPRLSPPPEPGRLSRMFAWQAKRGDMLLGYVVVDEVIGKFELISFAVGLAPDFTVRQLEVLAYRESHGHEIRLPAWRAQFVGKGPASPLAIGSDIRNISGATLSCTHVTDGVRLIVALAKAAFGAPA